MAKATSWLSSVIVMIYVVGFMLQPRRFVQFFAFVGVPYIVWFCVFIVALHFMFTVKGGTSEFKRREAGTPVAGQSRGDSSSFGSLSGSEEGAPDDAGPGGE